MEAAAGQNPTNSSALQLWLAYPGDLSEPAVEEACAALLDDAERARAARFRFDRHRREYLATHALTRVALSHAHPVSSQAWRFSVNKYGKPSPIPECGLRFNQSNSVELAVCLIARPVARPIAAIAAQSGAAAPDVGVDVESFARAQEIVPLAVRVFSAAERAQLEVLPITARPDRALSLWTLKEAYIKARGMGLSLPLDGISFLFDGPNTDVPQARRFESVPQATRFEVAPGVDDDPCRWRFCRFDHAGHRIALAVEAAAAGQLEIFEARPPLAPPARLAWGSPAWF
ncbi:MAG TPA: 4'-phosphopantetheinyl transferase superfamily protein [Terracidiphilus sp.]|nr:4'-phosphopantetheinyl transferase superfamily protein [Terracidiphilus sp.]